VDARGLIVAPGFIDLHAHGQTNRANEFQARDGVTTALELEGGYGGVEAVNDVGPNLVVPAPDDSPNRGQASFFLSVRVDTPMSTLVDIRHDGRKPRRRLRVCRALHHEGPSSVTTLVDIPRERYPWRSALLKARGV
jgi:hypothetical protein